MSSYQHSYNDSKPHPKKRLLINYFLASFALIRYPIRSFPCTSKVYKTKYTQKSSYIFTIEVPAFFPKKSPIGNRNTP